MFVISGYYIYIETSNPRQPNDNAKISKQVSLSGNSCLKFYYHMYGGHIETLTVKVAGKVVFQKRGSQGNKWMEAEVRLGVSGSAEVILKGVREVLQGNLHSPGKKANLLPKVLYMS